MSKVLFFPASLDRLFSQPSLICEFLKKTDFSSKIKPNDFLGIKIHFGEKGNKSFISPKLLKPLVQYLKKIGTKPFLFDTNTLYRGKRINAIDHIDIVREHGFFSLGVPIFIGDGLKGDDFVEVRINKKHYEVCYLARLWRDIDFILSLAHFTLHMLSGFGGSIKNLAMGIASRRGKLAQHCEVSPYIDIEKCITCGICADNCPVSCIELNEGKYKINSSRCIGCAQCISVCPKGAVKINWSNQYNLLQEKMVEYAYAVTKNKHCAFLNFATFITKECDCMNKEDRGVVQDLGILFSYDPLAIDKATVDLILERERKDVIKEVYPEIDYTQQFRYGKEVGLGSLDYILRKINL